MGHTGTKQHGSSNDRRDGNLVDPTVIQPAVPQRKLFEIRAIVEYAVVIAAETGKAALEHVKTWEHAWDSSSDLLGVSYVDIVDVREPASQNVEDLEDEAHEVV